MNLTRTSMFLILILILAACGQQQSNVEESSNRPKDDPASGGGIVAGKIEATIEVKGTQAIFQIKNQTEKVKELIIPGKTKYEYVISNEKGESVFRQSMSKPQYEQKHPIILKQAEALEFKLIIPDDLPPGDYTLTAVLHSKPAAVKAKTNFTVK